MAGEDGIGTNSPRNVWAGILFSLFAGFGGILFGFDTGVLGGIQAMQNWLCTFGKYDPSTGSCSITTPQQSLVVSILSVGTFFGALSGAPTGDFLGRRWSVFLAVIIFSVGVAMQAGAKVFHLFVAGRVFAGWGVGMVSTLIPIYQSECSPKWIRGAVVTGYQWAISIGLLVVAIVNNGTQNKASHASWQIPISIQFIWASILAVGIILLLESPRWLIKMERDEDAARALSRLTSLPPDHPDVQAELEEIRLSFEQEKRFGETSYLDCFRPSHNKILLRTFTGISIQACQQLTGINFIAYYGTVFFKNSGFQHPFLITVVLNVVGVITTVGGMWGIEKFGRRKMLLFGAAGMSFCQFLVAIIGVKIPISNLPGQKALVAFVCIYIAIFASTWGPGGWVVTSEIFPLNLRAKGMSLSTASNWLWNFGIGYATPYLINKGPGSAGLGIKVFYIWGSTCAMSFVFTYFFVAETKGLSLEQIDLLYQNTTPMRSVAYREQLKRDGVELTIGGAQTRQYSPSEPKEKL